MSLYLTDSWEKIQKGDMKTFEQLYKELFPGLYRFALKIIGDSFVSEEIVQDFFIKIWNDRQKIVIRGSVRNYFYTAIHHSSINAAIEKNALKNNVNRYPSDALLQKIQNVLSIDDSIIDNIEAKEKEQEILKQIDKLPQHCRTIFLMSRNENKTNKEIAVLLGLSENTVRTQLYRALEKILKEMQK